MKHLCAVLVALTLSSCASLKSVSLTPVPKDRSQPISAEVSDWVILGLVFDNDFVDQLRDQVREKCPDGKVTGIMAKYETYHYFLFYKRVTTANGYCVKESKKA